MKSIAFRLWIYILVLIFIILGSLWFLQNGLLNSFYINRETDTVKREVKALATLKDPGGLSKLEEDLERLSNTYSAIVDVIDANGRIIITAGNMMRGRINGIEAAEFPYVLKGEERVLKSSDKMMGIQIVTVALPVIYNNIIYGAIFVHIPFSSIEDTLTILQNQFFIVIIIAVLLATFGAFLISRKFTGPILKIIDAALMISKGKFETRVDIKYKDEIGKLGGTINHMAAELSKVENLRRDLIANISHEFRTPLGIIRSYGEGLLDKVYVDENEKEEYIKIIIDESMRLSKLVDDVLDISKLQSGSIAIEIMQFNLSQLIKRIHEKFKVLSMDKGISLSFNCDKNISALGDEARIEQVMINILNNSLNHTETGGSIEINVTSGEGIKVEVIDNGRGIPKEDLPYIFDRFYKSDKSGKKSCSGTGLGLAIVKEILISHDSSFGVESEIGEGTKFYFYLKKP